LSQATSQAPCVLWILTNLTNQFGPDAATQLTVCYQQTGYHYDANNCSLVTGISAYCASNCRQLLQFTIQMSVQLNCTADLLATVEQTSTAICDPFSNPPKTCLTGFACVNLTSYGEGYICWPTVPSTDCTFMNPGMPCTPCNNSAAAMCNVDFNNPLAPHPVCVQAMYASVNIFSDPLIDAYFYLYQTACQMSNTAMPDFCLNMVYASPMKPTCADVTMWGCCAGTYYDMVSYCQNPATQLINGLHQLCSSNDWTTKCAGGLMASNCCGKMTVCGSGATGVAPSFVVLALVAIYSLL